MIVTPLSHAKRKFRHCKRFVFADDVSVDLRTKLTEFDADSSDLIGVYLNRSEGDLTGMICFTNGGVIVFESDSLSSISYAEMADVSMTPSSESTAGYLRIGAVDGAESVLVIEGRDDSRGTDDTYDIYMFLQAVSECLA